MTDSPKPRDPNPIGGTRENDDPEQIVADGLEDEQAERAHTHPNDDPEQIVADGLEGEE